MRHHIIMTSLALAGLLSTGAHAQDLSLKQQYTADSKQAARQYASDKKLCADEGTSSARMRCTRDAKTEYDKALADARGRMQERGPRPGPKPQICQECARVVSVTTEEKAGEGSALGLIGGGVAGALLGNQVGSGHGRQLATLAGAAGGAYAGNKVEQRARTSQIWHVNVQYENGNKATFDFNQDPQVKAGDRVRNAGDSIARD